LELVKEHQNNWHDIVALEIGLAKRDANNQTRNSAAARPQSRDTANHSVRYSVAAALVNGELGYEQFDPDKLNSPDVLALIDCTSVYWEKDHDAYWPAANPATIRIRTIQGEELSKTLIVAPGNPDNPLSDEVLEQKFRQLTRKILSAEQISEVIAMTHRLDQLSHVRILTDALRPRS
jgi:2-methylcitrate dehydratase